MEEGALKNPGRACALIIALLCGSLQALALEIDTRIEPRQVRVGQVAQLSIRLSGVGSAEPATVPQIEGLDISFSGTQRSFEFINGQTWSGATLSFSVIPSKPGSYIIPSIEIRTGSERAASKPVKLFVLGGAREPQGGDSRLSASLSLSKKKVYVGEPVVMRYFLLHSGVELGDKPVFERLPSAKGLVQKPVDENIPEASVFSKDGEAVKSHLASFMLIPAQGGRLAAGGGSVVVQISVSESFFSFPRTTRIECPTEDIFAVALPEAGRPEQFQGDVGSFTMAADYSRDPIKIFEEKKITVTVKGRGNFASLSKPQALPPEGARLIAGESKDLSRVAGDTLEGSREFSFSIIPEKPGAVSFEGFSLSFFNPESGRYHTIRTDAVRFEARDDPKRGKDEVREEKGTGGLDVNLLVIGGIVLLIVGGAVFVVLWERRKLAASMMPVGDEKTKDTAPQGTRADGYIRELAGALRMSEGERFLRVAERVLREMDRIFEAKNSPPAGGETIERLRERIYAMKYGGGTIIPEEMNEIYEEIRRVYARSR